MSEPGWMAASPALALAAALMGAAAAAVAGKGARAAFVAGGFLALASGAATALAAGVLRDGRVEGAFGVAVGSAAPWRFDVDAFGACVLAALLALGAVVAIAAGPRFGANSGSGGAARAEAELDAMQPAAIAICAALSGVAVTTADLITAAAAAWGAAVAGVTAAAIAGTQSDRRALAAAFEALVAVSVAGALAVVGAALVASATGGAFWMVSNAAEIRSPRALALGLGLALAGLGALAALAPLHTWFAPATGRSGSWAPLISAVAALAVALRFVGAAVQTGDAVVPWMACVALAALGAASVAAGAAQALAARDAGRLVAYLVTSQLGLTALGVGFGTPEGASAAVLHAGLTLLPLATLAAAWPAIGAAGFDGLGARAPGLGAAATAALLSLLGAPLTAGFAGKWLLAAAALERGWYWAAWLLAAAALLGVVTVARVLERIWMRPSVSAAPRVAPSAALAWTGGVACLALGFEARGAEAIAHTAAQALLGAIR